MAKQHSPAFLELVDDAKTRISELDPDQLRERRQAHPDLQVVDVREDHEYEDEHVRDAHHLSKGTIERDVEEVFPDKDTEMVLYCGGGFRSALATDNLQRMGYRNVHSLDGGIRALKAAGFEMSA
jgi:rhodanese-related sulfurtransferase